MTLFEETQIKVQNFAATLLGSTVLTQLVEQQQALEEWLSAMEAIPENWRTDDEVAQVAAARVQQQKFDTVLELHCRTSQTQNTQIA
jgi:hypothetical protein